jgi:hypothetical protein
VIAPLAAGLPQPQFTLSRSATRRQPTRETSLFLSESGDAIGIGIVFAVPSGGKNHHVRMMARGQKATSGWNTRFGIDW